MKYSIANYNVEKYFAFCISKANNVVKNDAVLSNKRFTIPPDCTPFATYRRYF